MKQHLDKTDITGLILSGGRGKRMGSRDKGLMSFCGKPLFMHALERLKPQVYSILINANQHLSDYKQSGLTVISDEPLSFAGPLAGFAAGLTHCQTPYLLAIPCDSPFFPENLAEKLSQAMIQDKSDIAIAVTGSKPPYKAQPVFCLMKKTVYPHLTAFLAGGNRKIDAWYTTLKTSLVHFPDESAFYNINTQQELENLEKQYKK